LSGNSKGVLGRSKDGRGVHGEATGTSGVNYGVYGESKSSLGRGVFGKGNVGLQGSGTETGVLASGVVYGVSAVGDSSGVRGHSQNGRGVHGVATGTTGTNYGVYGESQSSGGIGVYGKGRSYGIVGDAPGTGNKAGVYGVSTSSLGTGVHGKGGEHGVIGEGGKFGVLGVGDDYGVRGQSLNGHAGYFIGKTHVAGTFTSSNKQFLVDHPLDPANRTLAHSCVEAPEMLNVYRGNTTLDGRGRATVRLPRYFRALNTDYSYQLTAVGAQAPGLYVDREIHGQSFRVAGGAPGQKVCWMVTGARQDAWAKEHPLRVEQRKRRADRGKFLNPEAYGKPREAGIHYVPLPKQRRVRRRKATA
jgi:hypothetical protein